ncbi:unnamed protein product [Trichobilharzia szidati]|nr:unnamed protein product [Trichobilharzia szidati]CAH8869189.1 unnamed protein product [Trichobilharzia szidati]
MKVNSLIVPRPAVNRKSYRWDEPQQPTLLSRSKYLRQFRKYHSNSYDKRCTRSGDNPSPHSGSAVDVNKRHVSHNSSTKRKRTNNSRQKSSANSKRNSPLSVSSLDSDEMAEVQNKLDNLQILLSQTNNLKVNDEKIGDSTAPCIKPDECDIPKMEVLQDQAQDENKPVRKIDESVSFQKLPNYVTFSVKKSHQYAVRNWLLSNYNHI